MLDEALPTFFLKSTRQSHLQSIYFCQHGNDPLPAYSLRHADPSTPDGKNRYAAALVDPYVPDIIYGEILIIPEWTQPSLSADAIRANGGVTPPPEPLLPTSFVIHLYNPDQQVTVHFKPKSWNSPATWTFEMPQHTFRQPSSSSLDRTQTDPAAADTTPKLRFNWRRDSKLSKDLTCYLSGKATSLTEGKNKTKSKEPDIILSIFKGLREMTLYEPNLYRVEMEDFKGLEVVLLLGAVAIRDVYFSTMKDSFNLSKQAPVMSAGPAPVPTSTSIPTTGPSPATAAAAAVNGNHRASLPPINTQLHQKQPPPVASGGLNAPSTQPQPHPSKPTASNSQPKPAPSKHQEQQRKEEERRTQKLLEQEDKARRRRQAEVDQETRRLQRLYGQEEHRARTQTPSLPPRASRPHQPSRPHAPPQPRPMQPNGRGAPAQRYYYYHHHSPSTPHIPAGPYLSPTGRRDPRQQSTVTFAAPDRPQSTGTRPLQPKKSSFFGFRKSSDEREREKLSKKRSSMF
ncbi:hypothetical protein P170DRAFT_433103 [Aspergillus steynii IBT 23096]|uniref:Uncharacterized protein n=1 Tax=Aspergillus steynii IBT 23096 TaxID=1392250 RepID=A0A2I2GRU3_9EURO|nr:uncharacterized protein P170DRAFT_433103 [Aspergillus steynii IBT 23096]PLB55583.1 hypothetical protein P170DRAFT_433103 [Aspergillus steynii IBT 23096]